MTSANPISNHIEMSKPIDSISPTDRSPISTSDGDRHQPALRWFHLFALICAGIFIMTIGMVVGAQVTASAYFNERETLKKNAAAALLQCQNSSKTIQLWPEDIEGDSYLEKLERSPKKTKSRAGRVRRKALSEEEKAIIAQMDNGPDHSPTNVKTPDLTTTDHLKEDNVGLKPEQLYEVINQGKRDLRRCYETALRASPSKETFRLDIDMTVSMSGTVINTNARGQSLGNMKLCIERITRMWRFPTADRETQTSFPVVFQPGMEPDNQHRFPL